MFTKIRTATALLVITTLAVAMSISVGTAPAYEGVEHTTLGTTTTATTTPAPKTMQERCANPGGTRYELIACPGAQ
jgi:hypothetical protein